MLRVAILFAVCCTSGLTLAQSSNFSNSGSDWKKTQHELFLGVGVTNFLGDLGGLDQVGTDYSIKDLELSLTSFSLSGSYRLRLKKTLSTRTSFLWGRIKGNDQLTAETFRNYRNLHFRSNIWELSQVLEFGYSFDKAGHRYNLQGPKGFKSSSFYMFAYAGVGLMYFNPKAEYGGSWVALQPLGTEGQVVSDTIRKYSRITYNIPVGIGARVLLLGKLTLGLDLSYRKSGSDYLDDVSKDYYDNTTIRNNQGNAAADLADPSSGSNWNWTIHGEQRGDPKQKDAILAAHFTIGYIIEDYGRRVRGGRKKSKAFGKRKHKTLF